MTTTEAAPSTEAAPGTGYRPHLDGMRVLAVYLVVLFHAGVTSFSGGFVGVDVFFVLSGYLVTQVLVRSLRLADGDRPITDGDPHQSRWPHGFSRFYARRYRRLLPASFVALVVTAVVYSSIASQAELAGAVGAFKATFLYVANWYFIHQSSDYFAAAVNANPVQQFWSLAVEEQFYFVWPILLTALYLVSRWRVAARAPCPPSRRRRRDRGVRGLGAAPRVDERQPRLLRDRCPGLPAPGRGAAGAEPRSGPAPAQVPWHVVRGSRRRRRARRAVDVAHRHEPGPTGHRHHDRHDRSDRRVGMPGVRPAQPAVLVRAGGVSRSDLLRDVPVALAGHHRRVRADGPRHQPAVDLRDLGVRRHRARVPELSAPRDADPPAAASWTASVRW